MPRSEADREIESEYDELAERQRVMATTLLSSSVEQLAWPADQLASHRKRRLRGLVSHAMARSPWHAERLRGLNPESLDETRLADLPVMTKDDLMANWDRIATDPELRLDRCEAHLESLSEPRYLADRYHVVASGGSSGRRGVFAYNWDGWVTFYTGYVRWLARRAGREGWPPPAEMVTASVGAQALTHPTVALNRTFSGSGAAARSFPVSQPLGEIVAGLNELQPHLIFGYASALGLLAREAAAGRLSVAPRAIVSSAEPLLLEVADAIRAAWGVEPTNVYGTSDAGIVAMGCGAAPGLHVNDDELVIEAVDVEGAPTAPGECSAKLYVTVLFQRALPLIRYELTDQIEWIAEPCPCGSTFRRIRDIQGRLDDHFVYPGGVTVHPHVFRSPLARAGAVVEYQVRQTADGAEVDVVATEALDASGLAAALERALAGVGLDAPRVRVARVERLARIGVGKLKRFLPLGRGTEQRFR